MSAARHGVAAKFPTTRWSLVDLIRQGDADATREALGQLLSRYLPALHAHLVYGRRLAPDQADDLVQEFVASKILEKGLIGQADRQLGRLRTFLLTALDRFFIDHLRHAGAKKRSPGQADLLPLGDRAESLPSEGPPTDVFGVTWARSVIAEALRRMRHSCQTSGRDDVWGVFESRLADPILKGTEPVDYSQLTERFGLKSPAQASNVLITAKRMYARALRSVVAEYAQDAQETEDEIEELRQILAGSDR